MKNLADINKKLAKTMAGNVDHSAYAFVSTQVEAIERRGGNPADYSLVMINTPQDLVQEGNGELSINISMELRIVETSKINDPKTIVLTTAIQDQIAKGRALGDNEPVPYKIDQGLKIINVGLAAGMSYDQIGEHMLEMARRFAQYGDQTSGKA